MKIRSTPIRAAMLAIVALISLRLPAQEVTVGEIGWFKAEGVPDTPPRAKRPLRPKYPDDLRKTNESGYVIVTRFVDAGGESRVLGTYGAHPWFQKAVQDEIGDWEMRPATRGGKPVSAWFWIPVIFNPASSAPGQTEAMPRLLAVTPVVVPDAMMAKLRDNTTAQGTVSLDPDGVPQKVVLEPPASDKLLPFVQAALKQWRFAPARQGGLPVASDFRVAFHFFPPVAPVPTQETPPRVVKQEAPVYPEALTRSGIVGEVLVWFVVNPKGSVVNPVVRRSNNPAFDQPAIAAVLRWKFEPGKVDGRPVNTSMSVPIIFNFTDGGGREAWAVDSPGRRARARLPQEIQYDVAPKLLGLVNPVYPYTRLRENTKGRATVLFQISPEGRVVGSKVVESTHPEFGLALTAAVERYEFTPALKDGKPTATVLKTEQEFDSGMFHGTGAHAEEVLLKREKDKPESIAGADKLDALPKPLSRRPPVFPVSLLGKAEAGTARIEVLVDEDGHTHLPRIAEASDPAFGYAAVQAVSEWLFETPKAGGKPVIARVIIPFNFTTKPLVMGTAVGEEK